MTHSCPRCSSLFSRMWSLSRHLRKCRCPQKTSTSDLEGEEPSGENDPSLRRLVRVKNRRSESESSAEVTHSSHQTGRIKRPRVDDTSEEAEEEGEEEEEEEEEEEAEEVEESNRESDNESVNESSSSDIGSYKDIGYRNGSFESDSEMDDSDDGDDDEISMFEDETQKIKVQWPISRKYRISYPWEFWGEIPRIKRHVTWVERLRDAYPTTVMYNIQYGTNSELATLSEIAYNCLHGNIPMEHWHFKELCKQRWAVRHLVDTGVDMEGKRKKLLQKGAHFVQSLLHLIEPLILLNIPRLLKVHPPYSPETEEVESEDAEKE